ncbi:hypothetical protein [Planktomarina sp.]|uniref:hypothetical protein n=1 Tax=Planktomarina sp. TaxID=2024851 RepID=UPI003C4470D4
MRHLWTNGQGVQEQAASCAGLKHSYRIGHETPQNQTARLFDAQLVGPAPSV